MSSDWALSGFVGGLSGYDKARNIEINVAGKLDVVGGIVGATGAIEVNATSISADGASVFIADDLSVQASNTIQLNTLVE